MSPKKRCGSTKKQREMFTLALVTAFASIVSTIAVIISTVFQALVFYASRDFQYKSVEYWPRDSLFNTLYADEISNLVMYEISNRQRNEGRTILDN